jgi:predicted MFS family arabinose efflux permease
MVTARFCFGIGAAGAYPNAAGVITRWFPRREHARAQGFVWAASRLGGALAPLLLVPLGEVWGWRAIFWMMGGVGIVWSVLWWTWFRTLPEDAAGISPRELHEIVSERVLPTGHAKVPWSALLRLPQLWLIVAAYFCYGWGSWFFFGWFATWMVRGAGFTVEQMGIFASFPFAMAMCGNLVGGIVSQRLVMRIGAVRAYRWVTAVCLIAGASLLLAMSMVRRHDAIVVISTLAFGIMDLMLPSAWAMCMRLGGAFGGTATAVMNTAGNLGGWFSALLFGYVVKATGDYNLPLQWVAVMVFIAALLFSRVDSSHGLSSAPQPA